MVSSAAGRIGSMDAVEWSMVYAPLLATRHKSSQSNHKLF